MSVYREINQKLIEFQGQYGAKYPDAVPVIEIDDATEMRMFDEIDQLPDSLRAEVYRDGLRTALRGRLYGRAIKFGQKAFVVSLDHPDHGRRSP